MDDRLKEIEQRLKKARADRSQYDNYIDTAFRYSIPQRRIYLEAQNKMKPNPELYDSTAVVGTQRFATKLQSMLVPTAQTWMKFENGSDIPDGDEADSRQLQLDKDTETFFDELKHSNFDTQVAESFQDLAVTTGAILINPAPIGSHSAVVFKAVPINELYVEVPSSGAITTAWREYTIRVADIESTYPGAKLNEKYEREVAKDPNATCKVTESVIFRIKENQYDVDICDMKTDYFFRQTVEETSPWVIFRENVVPGASLGFGRILRVLPDIKMVNKIKELVVKGGSIAVSGTFTAHDDGVLNPYNVRLRAGGVIPVNSNDARNPSIARLDTPTNFDWATIEIQALQATINDVLLSNPYGSIEQTPVRSATEIASRNRELFDSVSSSFGRMQVEFVAPTIKRVLAVLQKAGRIREDLVLDGRDVSFNFISPLTRLQQSADIENVLEWLSIVGTMGEEVTQLTVKIEDVPRWLAEQYSVPQELVRTQSEAQSAGKVAQDQAMPPIGPDGQPLAGGMVPSETPGVASPGGLDPMFG